MRKDLARSGALDRVRAVVVMRLLLLGRELVALADFSPVIAVDELLRPRLLVEIRRRQYPGVAGAVEMLAWTAKPKPMILKTAVENEAGEGSS